VRFNQILCGLHIRSEIPLPELARWTGGDRPVDIEIRLGAPTRPALGSRAIAPRLTLEPDGTALLTFENAATFRVRAGREVIVSDLKVAADDVWLRLHLLGSVLAILCHQRGLLPLHGSCVRVDGGAVAILAPSGTGKSTMAGALQRLGFMVLGDDVCALDLAGTVPLLLPAFSRVKLWHASLALVGRSTDCPVDACDRNQFLFLGEGEFDPAPLPLRAIYMLEVAAPGGAARVNAVENMADRLRVVTLNIVRSGFAEAIGRRTVMFEQAVSLATTIPIRRLIRCAERERISETLDTFRQSL
jgi:hypothetical protein